MPAGASAKRAAERLVGKVRVDLSSVEGRGINEWGQPVEAPAAMPAGASAKRAAQRDGISEWGWGPTRK
jgi:hypothetical protein